MNASILADGVSLARYQRLLDVGLALGSEKNQDRLMERILVEAKEMCKADGGTLYLRTDDDKLSFSIMRTDSLNIQLGGTTGQAIHLPSVPLFNDDGEPNRKNVASYCVHLIQSVNIEDAYNARGFDFSGTRRFDEKNHYRSKSFLTIPMTNQDGRVIGVLQLLNAKNENGDVVPFSPDLQEMVEALASQAAVALDNQLLADGQRKLMEAFIKLIAAAIDDKSPYTGGHCRRVPLLTLMLAEAARDDVNGPFKVFQLEDDERYELKIAAWLHDCGKIITPTHVMDKATKLEAIYDRIHDVKARIEILRQDARILCLQTQLDGGERGAAEKVRDATIAELDENWLFLETANIGGEFMSDEEKARVRTIEQTQVCIDGIEGPLLDEDEAANLCISRGTLNDEERIIINGHMVQTIRMLESLPFPRSLQNVPEIAGGHHEKMDGTGYPKGVFAGDMSVLARTMAIADVFEALTAQDRPYKKGKPLSEAMRIMGFMKKDNHLDADLFNLFVTSGVYRKYATDYLPVELIDDVDEAALLAIEPKPFVSPERHKRDERKRDFLDEYRTLVRRTPAMDEVARHDKA
ncbi:MAG: GAF domain-containing protein [Deltaproteobacteria bacterium]|nr:GAF domain-containing protein [Deltaproteobacteria bacterium]